MSIARLASIAAWPTPSGSRSLPSRSATQPVSASAVLHVADFVVREELDASRAGFGEAGARFLHTAELELRLLERGHEVHVREADLDLYDAYNADEAFLTSTSLCICPITRINGVTIGAEGRVRIAGPVL